MSHLNIGDKIPEVELSLHDGSTMNLGDAKDDRLGAFVPVVPNLEDWVPGLEGPLAEEPLEVLSRGILDRGDKVVCVHGLERVPMQKPRDGLLKGLVPEDRAQHMDDHGRLLLEKSFLFSTCDSRLCCSK